MDKQVLVNALDKVFGALKRTGHPVSEYRVMPEYLGYRELPLLVGVVVPSWRNKPSVKTKISTIVDILHSGILTSDERAYISGVIPYNSQEEMNEFFDEQEGVGRPVVEPYWPD